MKEFLLKIIYSKYFLILIVALIGITSNYFLGDNNPIEEIVEEIIKDQTGLEINFNDFDRT